MTHYTIDSISSANTAQGRAVLLAKRSGLPFGVSRAKGGLSS